MKTKFTKADLRTGDFLVRRNGSVEVVMLATDSTICKTGGWNDLDDLTDELVEKDSNDTEWDVVKVYRPIDNSTTCFKRYHYGDLVYSRNSVMEVTMTDIEKVFGCKVKIVNEKEEN